MTGRLLDPLLYGAYNFTGEHISYQPFPLLYIFVRYTYVYAPIYIEACKPIPGLAGSFIACEQE